jgi:hypothetical protein
MTDIESIPAETYPWDRTEPFIPGVSASLIVVEATKIETFDNPNKNYRVVGLRLGADLTVHVGLSGGDTEVVAVLDRLSEAIDELRAAALHRMIEPEAVPA